MTTPSMPARSSVSTLSTASASSLLARSTARPGIGSVSTSVAIAGSLASVSAWKAPIRPRPMRPILMCAPFLVDGTDDVLVPVDDRAGDHAAAVGEQEDHE